MNDGVHSDAWCQNISNVIPPAYNFGAHMAPMDILFNYDNKFPQQFLNTAFVSFHGSWDREPPAGYRVEAVDLNANGFPVSDANFFAYEGPGDTGINWPHRPVGLAMNSCPFGSCLYVASDASNVVIAIGMEGQTKRSK